MYKPGDIKVLTMPCDSMDEDGYCDFEYDEDEHNHAIIDSADQKEYIAPNRVAYLPHSCNDWVIGGKTEIELMIADLQEALKKLS